MRLQTRIKEAPRILLSLALLIAATGCGPSAGVQSGFSESDARGTIAVSGAWALYPLMIRWGEEYQEINPGVRVDVSAGGAGKGMADALAGAVDIGMVSREIYPEEVEKGAFWVSVTKDAVLPTVNQENPVWEDLHQQGATRDTFVGIYITGEITTWGQVVGRPEVEDCLHARASGLSTRQQQRLYLARALAVEPEVLLCDEPTSALDPISAERIEEQLVTLKEEMTIVMVTHSLQQARRLADHAIFLWMGELVEFGAGVQVFHAPKDERTQAYLAGDIG